jgi:hypothetical protein
VDSLNGGRAIKIEDYIRVWNEHCAAEQQAIVFPQNATTAQILGHRWNPILR